MKAASLILAVSLAANAALAALLLAWPGRERATRPSAQVAPSAPIPPTAATAGAQEKNPAAGLWPLLPVDDLPRLVAQLRAAGFPPTIVRAIVTPIILGNHLPPRHPPLAPGVSLFQGTENWVAAAKKTKEQHAILTQLFGADWLADDAYRYASLTDQYGELPPEKLLRISEIADDVAIAEMGFCRETPDSIFGPSDEEMAPVLRQKRARLAGILTPAELAEHELRTDPLVAELGRRLGEFEPTEAEFRAFLDAHRIFNAAFPPTPGVPNPARIAAESALPEKLAAALSPDRAAEFRQIGDPTSARLDRLVLRLDLPVSAAIAITATKDDIARRAATVRAAPTLSAPERAAQLAALASEATAKITAALGSRGLRAYRENGGYWLDLLTDYLPPP